MKKILILLSSALLLASCPAHADELKIGFVNVKNCMEKSKVGVDEKNTFEALKKQMTDALEKSDKELVDLAKKLEDQDYLDSLSPAAEEELRVRFDNLSQDFSRYQNQYYQLLQQANYKMIHTLHDSISQASEEVRAKNKLTIIMNQDSAFAVASSLDVTEAVINEMNQRYEKTKTATADVKTTEKKG
jgi:outer membrane protein